MVIAFNVGKVEEGEEDNGNQKCPNSLLVTINFEHFSFD